MCIVGSVIREVIGSHNSIGEEKRSEKLKEDDTSPFEDRGVRNMRVELCYFATTSMLGLSTSTWFIIVKFTKNDHEVGHKMLLKNSELRLRARN